MGFMEEATLELGPGVVSLVTRSYCRAGPLSGVTRHGSLLWVVGCNNKKRDSSSNFH